MLHELQIEGLVGPTHNYAGLSFGNIASKAHAQSVSYPKAAALQSLDKMKTVHEMGIPVAIMPPHPRPAFSILSRLGYRSTHSDMLAAAWADSPELAAAIWSASSMWAANAATVTPSTDSTDGLVHLTPANLFSTLHRAIEPRTTTHFLRQIFADTERFAVHDPLPVTTRLADEGAANHMRLHIPGQQTGMHIFIYGASPESLHYPTRYPARQQRSACEAIARMHQLPAERTLYVQQSPEAIDAGVFHNDVIAMSHANLLICHERAYVDQDAFLLRLTNAIPQLQVRIIRENELSLADAVKTYFFNAQLLPANEKEIAILFPQECAEHPAAQALCEKILKEENPVTRIDYMNLRESMKNGGGPACLRLRVPLTAEELAAVHSGVRFSTRLYQRLHAFIEDRYPEQLLPNDLKNIDNSERLLDVQAALIALFGMTNPS